MKTTYFPKGTCSNQIDMEIEDGVIKSVDFHGGCGGNTSGISKLVEGMKPEEVVERLRGIKCGHKNTSCPDQLADAIEKALKNA